MRKRHVIFSMVGAAFACLLSPVTLSADAGDQFIVKTADLEVLQAFAAEHGAQVSPLIFYPNPSKETMELFGNSYVLTFPDESESAAEDRIQMFETLPGVAYAEPNARVYLAPGWDEEPVEDFSPSQGMNPDDPYTPNDPLYDQQWDKPIAETDWAWNTSKGEGVIIAIIDTGVDTTHEDLVDNLVDGYNFALNNTNIWDVKGHGTTVCGMAGARMDNNLGVAGTAGLASIMMLRIADNSGAMYLNWAVNAVNYAADNGAKVISMSFIGGAYTPFETALNNAWNKGVFLCGGVGNSGNTNVGYPAAYERVMAVGASNQEDTRLPQSNYGEKVDIFAPGGYSTKRGGGYVGTSLTSFTTPQIAGLAALVFSAYPHATPQQVWDNIIQGADTIASDVGPILRMNSRKAVEMEIIAVEERKPEPIGLWAASVQSGVIRFTYDLPASTSYNLRIFDVTGRELYAERGRTDMKGEISCSPALGSGIYFWRFKASEGTSSGKFIYVR